ncbi:hypothetical protein D9C73_001798 [Collichthys lucidus]|uniref:Uncharacterized protein n=1 Tax=Collichthys lucidus TaxID=240159 RepID=A0A4U5TZC8_COLLU|nr:hypothetical protein D9C73_001798 [Collichthys lucidus]
MGSEHTQSTSNDSRCVFFNTDSEDYRCQLIRKHCCLPGVQPSLTSLLHLSGCYNKHWRGTLCLGGILFMLFVIWLLRRYHSLAQKMILSLTVAAFFDSVAYVMVVPSDGVGGASGHGLFATAEGLLRPRGSLVLDHRKARSLEIWDPVSLLSVLLCSPALSRFPRCCGPWGTSRSEDQGIFISSNYIKPDERLEAKAAPRQGRNAAAQTRVLSLRAEVLALKVKSGKGGRGDIKGAVRQTGGISQQEERKERQRTAGWEEEESERNRLSSSLPTPRSVSSSEFSEARRQDRGGGGGSEEEEEEEEGVKGDERGRRMESRGQRFVTEVQNFRG